jgi:hypothetical protein
MLFAEELYKLIYFRNFFTFKLVLNVFYGLSRFDTIFKMCQVMLA